MVAVHNPRKVLVVDDESLVRQTLRLLLRDEYDVTAVSSGEEAIEASRLEAFPVVILDLCMEGLSGIETLKRLREIREQQNVIILTAYESTESAISALNLGAFNYLTKPFQRTHLREVVSRGFEAYEKQTVRRAEMKQRLMTVHDEFFSLLCHEFNTPLNIILGFSDLLAQSATDPEQVAWAGHVKDAGDQLHEVLMEIVDYVAASNLAASGLRQEFVPAHMLDSVVEGFKAKGVTMDVVSRIPASRKLEGAVNSIVTIARKLSKIAAHRSKRIRVTLECDEGASDADTMKLRITVEGTGIRVESLLRGEVEDLFEPYHRSGTQGECSAWPSLGLELATCRKIAEYAEGHVNCQFTASGELQLSADLPVRSL